jgi:signal transduction histidine kinase
MLAKMTPTTLRSTRDTSMVLCLYICLYVTLDRVSTVQVLPDLGFTLWNPPPACSLALLLSKGLQFAPALFPAAVLADTFNTGFSIGILPSLTVDAMTAIGYSAVAAVLRPIVGPAAGFQSTRNVTWFLVVAFAGVLIVAGLVCTTLVLMHVLPPDQFVAAFRHFWIGDVTGIVGLLPVLMTGPLAWERWRELSVPARCADLGFFAIALACALWLIFGVAAPKEFQFFYLLLLPMIWIGVRHGLPWCAIAILLEQSALIAVVAWHDYSLSEFTDFQILSLAIAITGLLLGAVVTEQHRTELRLRQQQAELARMARLTTAGALGSAIAHEVSQPLAIVSTYAHACRLMLKAGTLGQSSLTDSLAKLEAEALRAGEIVERLRDFLAGGDTRFVSLDLGEVVRDVVRAQDDEARSHGVTVSLDIQPHPQIVGDRLQLGQVLLNLLRNGIEAAAENRTRQKLVWIRLRHSDSGIQLDVEDNGPGVPPDIADHMFEPFATGKPKGMGLGLLLSRQIIEFHGGVLWHDRAAATGARFAFRLPTTNSDVR